MDETNTIIGTEKPTGKKLEINIEQITLDEKHQMEPRIQTSCGCCGGFGEECFKMCGELGERCQQFSCRDCVSKTCTVENAKKKLPIISWLPKYSLGCLKGDVIAGLTVGLTVIPQGLAYAKVAELPPQYGLYSAFMGCFVYCFLGTSKDITLGPTAIMSLMTAEFGHSPVENDATLAIMLSLIGGILQLAMGILHIGFLVDFISHPVINSFTTSAAITIAVGQVKSWLGLKGVPRHFIPQVIGTCKKIPETNIADAVLGLICMLILFGMKKLKDVKFGGDNPTIGQKVLKQIIWLVGTARNAIIVVITSGIAAIFIHYDVNINLTLTGNITSGLPEFRVPSFSVYDEDHNVTMTTSELFSTIGSGFAIVPLIGLVETIAIGKAFARKNKYKLDANQELIAIGASNIVGSFVGAYPVTGSFSRTAVNSQSGVKTPAGGIVTGALVILALAVLTPLFYFIPNAALAGVIIMAVLDMADFSLVKELWKIKKIDLIPWFATFIFSFVLGIEYGIMIGIGVSLLFLLYPWSRPGYKVTKEETTSLLRNTAEGITQKGVMVITLNQGLRFPGIEYFKDQMVQEAIADDIPQSVVLDFCHISGLDYSSVHGLQQLVDDFKLNGIVFVLANLQPEVLSVLQRADITSLRYCDSVDDAIRSIYEENEPDEENPRRSLLGSATALGTTDLNSSVNASTERERDRSPASPDDNVV